MESRCSRCPFVAKTRNGFTLHEHACKRKFQCLNPDPPGYEDDDIPIKFEEDIKAEAAHYDYEEREDFAEEADAPPVDTTSTSAGARPAGVQQGEFGEEDGDQAGRGGFGEEKCEEEGAVDFEVHQPGCGRYIPNRQKACKKFWDIQMEQADYSSNPTPSVNGPISRLMKLSEEDLDTAVMHNDLVLSRAETAKIMKFTERACSRRTGEEEKLRSVKAVMNEVKKACDRSQDEGVMRHAMYHVEAPPRDIPEEIDFMWIDVMHAAVELLTDAHLSTQPDGYLWKPTAPGSNYAELNSGTWWRTVHENSRAEETGFEVVPILLATDGSAQDFRRSLSIQPINITVGNFPGSALRTDASKRCVAYWPDLKTKSKSVLHERLQRKLYQWVLGNITGNIAEYADGFLLKVQQAQRDRQGRGAAGRAGLAGRGRQSEAGRPVPSDVAGYRYSLLGESTRVACSS